MPSICSNAREGEVLCSLRERSESCRAGRAGIAVALPRIGVLSVPDNLDDPPGIHERGGVAAVAGRQRIAQPNRWPHTPLDPPYET